MEQFFEKANKAGRFDIWLKGAESGQSYMTVDYDHKGVNDMQMMSELLGIQLKYMLTVTSSVSENFTTSDYSRWMRVNKFGISYVFDTETLFTLEDADLMPERVKEFARVVIINNLKLSLADAQLLLLKTWRKFVEIYIDDAPLVVSFALHAFFVAFHSLLLSYCRLLPVAKSKPTSSYDSSIATEI